MTEEKAPAGPPPLPRPRGRPWRTVLLAAGVLVCGMVIGSGLTLLGAQRRALYFVHHPEKAPAAMARRLRWRLGLSAEQTRRVEQVLRERQKALQALRRQWQPQVAAEIETARREVAAVLTSDQAKRWDELFETLRRRWMPPPPPEDAGPAGAP